ncbi:hypothetical protein WDU94_009008, partial [Cyamophila willieti]
IIIIKLFVCVCVCVCVVYSRTANAREVNFVYLESSKSGTGRHGIHFSISLHNFHESSKLTLWTPKVSGLIWKPGISDNSMYFSGGIHCGTMHSSTKNELVFNVLN